MICQLTLVSPTVRKYTVDDVANLLGEFEISEDVSSQSVSPVQAADLAAPYAGFRRRVGLES